ncbi:hypothetical protein QJS10_CPA09g01417 [Acorus calamus]|uniref:Uncharacterized protein n=1 Tax=Acorus calamus TaxID=4465 RepID=A0AAV9E671_ACOCL|nr:hypothetical protein QJS10_CPA09g01417 [Acorus calamus]
MAAFQISTNLSVINTFCVGPSNKRSCSGIKSVSPTCCSSLNSGFLNRNGSKIGSFGAGVAFLGGKDLILRREKGRRGCFVVVRANQGFGFNGGGDGGRDNSTTARVIGNLALAIGLTYLSMTGQLGWYVLIDAIIIAVLVPIVGFGAFLWYAGREIIQSSGNEFVRESSIFSSKQSTGFRQAFNGFSPRSEKGKTSSTAVVDIEAEVKDID